MSKLSIIRPMVKSLVVESLSCSSTKNWPMLTQRWMMGMVKRLLIKKKCRKKKKDKQKGKLVRCDNVKIINQTWSVYVKYVTCKIQWYYYHPRPIFPMLPQLLCMYNWNKFTSICFVFELKLNNVCYFLIGLKRK